MSEPSQPVSITVTPQGPYVVKGGPPIRRKRIVSTERDEPVAWELTGTVAASEEYSLCRCGGSSNKPFCDGTHEKRDWDGSETAATTEYDVRATSYPGTGMTMRDDRSICEHAGFCANKTSNVWKMSKLTADTAVRSQVMGMIDRCPSGALTYRADAGGPDLEPDLPVAINVVDDGPLFVTGGVPVTRADGAPLETRNRMTLCRCGASKNKPLCDGSHADAGFHDPLSGPSTG